MRLSYRGIEFESGVSVATTSELGISGKYRGQAVAFRRPQVPTMDSAIALQYRGTRYLR